MPIGVYQRKTLEERFWAKVQKTDTCWNWTAGLSQDGYGKIEADGKTDLAHRVSYRWHIGQIPNGHSVLHHCDNPKCVRPDHLFTGTQADNVADSVLKNRRAAGSRHGLSKMTEAQVMEGLRLRAQDKKQWTYLRLAERYGVAKCTAHRAFTGRTWSTAKNG